MIELRDYQKEAINSTYQYINDGKGNPVISAACGAGKSIIQAKIASDVRSKGKRFLMLVHTKELVEQNANKIKALLPDEKIGICCSGITSKKSAKENIVCASPQTFVNMIGKIEEGFDVLTIDECFSGDTEILTEKGFVRFDKLKNEKVAQVTKDDQFIDFVNYTRKIEKTPESDVYHIRSDKGVDLILTAGHEMLLHNKRAGEWVKKKLEESNFNPHWQVAKSGFSSHARNTLTPFEKLAIAFQADGTRHCENRIYFSFSKQIKIDYFLKLMEELGCQYEEISPCSKSSEKVKDKRRFSVVNFGLTKDIPSYFNINELSVNKAIEIIEYMNIWDGHIASKNCYLYTNTDKKSVDFYQAVCCLCGYSTKMVRAVDKRSDKFNDVFRLFITKKQMASTQSWKKEKIEFKDKVYCVEVPKGNIVVRRKGMTLVVGNCHRIPFKKESVYQKIISFLKLLNPNMIIIGMSGTPFREDGTVYDTQGSIFSGLSYDIGIKELLQKNYLCPVISRGGVQKIDLSSVKKLGGEYNQSDLARAADVDTLNESVVNDIIENGYDRNCWLVFCSGIQHGEHLKEKFILKGIIAEVITNNTSKQERENIIDKFKKGEIKCLINNSILNTGFDHPPIDLVAFVRATLSTSLFIQSVSRGIRKHSSKENCLLLDYGNNIETHGFIDEPTPKIKKKGDKREPVTRECPKCHLILPVQSRVCECGYEFPIAETVATYQSYSYDGAVTSDQVKPIGKYVKSIMCKRHKKKNSIDSVKITYLFEDLSSADEYLCLDHGGYASIKAKSRVKEMGGISDSVSSALDEWISWSKPTKAILSFDQKYKRYKIDRLFFN